MALAPGQKLAHYEIASAIGAGGMGEVYRARDTKLDRDVAIKVLPEEFAADEERVARFEREAKLLASLNHPNIASIYGFESNALVLELVEGPTLADRIERSPIPVDEAIAIAKQIAEALEAGHEAGVIHRDLKPANIKVRDDGTVKVLDYGLAKALEGDTAAAQDSELSQSPTLTRQGTQIGVILGTAAYMSPEQAKGKRVDKRTDIWAFGAVFFEMLTGERAFPGADVSETLAAVLMKDVDWSALPSKTPAWLHQLLRRCMERDPKQRLRDIGEARIQLGVPAEVVPPATHGSPRMGVAAAALVLGALVAGVAVWQMTRDSATQRRVVRSSIPLPEDLSLTGTNRNAVALSPDGSRIVFSANDQLYIRELDDNDASPIAGTEGGHSPFFSPDGESVGFLAQGQLRTIVIRGGVPVSLCDVRQPWGMRWNADDTVVFGERGAGILRVSSSGGTPEVLVSFPEWAEMAFGPQILPRTKAVLFTLANGSNWADSQVVVESLETGERTVLVERASDAHYLSTGHLVYLQDGKLLAVPFDVDALAIRGSPVPVVDRIMTGGVAGIDGHFSVSDSGNLVYLPEMRSTSNRTLTWVDRDGREEAIAAEPRGYSNLQLSPDGKRVVLGDEVGNDLWIWDLERETLSQFTFSPAVDMRPIWAPDGTRVIFGSARAGLPNMFWKAADGTGVVERMNESAKVQFPHAFTLDGRQLIFWETEGGSGDLALLPMDGPPKPLLATEFDENNPALSPDGGWLAYESNASGETEIYVRPFPNVQEGPWAISKGGGSRPRWAKDGTWLFYISSDSKLMAVAIETETGFVSGNPEELFGGFYANGIWPPYDISPDGERFIVIKDADAPGQSFVLVQNWFEELNGLVPVNQ